MRDDNRQLRAVASGKGKTLVTFVLFHFSLVGHPQDSRSDYMPTMFLYGSPCPPFSILNNKRKSVNPFSTAEGEVFMMGARFIRVSVVQFTDYRCCVVHLHVLLFVSV